MDSLEADYIKKMRKHDAELANGWGQIATPPFSSDWRRASTNELRQRDSELNSYWGTICTPF